MQLRREQTREIALWKKINGSCNELKFGIKRKSSKDFSSSEILKNWCSAIDGFGRIIAAISLNCFIEKASNLFTNSKVPRLLFSYSKKDMHFSQLHVSPCSYVHS